MPFRPIITLLTDFGSVDSYVGTMKGVILGINPEAQIVDLCHEVEAQDITEGAYLLKTAYRYFPEGTVHLIVVDPGVGTLRRAVVLLAGKWFFVGPDNGVLSYVLRDQKVEKAVELTVLEYQLQRVGETFHGRDVFAPAAAHIASGAALEKLGPPAPDLVRLDELEPRLVGGRVIGRVIHVDRFGNCITNIERSHVASPSAICAGRTEFPGVSRTYADVPKGQPLALFGSAGHLEIAVNGGNAAADLGLRKGDEVLSLGTVE